MENSSSFLGRLNKFLAPEAWIEYAKTFGIGPIWLVDDFNLPRSIRIDKEIYVNIRREHWENYKKLFGVGSYEEAVVFRYLHETGHIVLGHAGEPTLQIGPDGISRDFEEKIKAIPLEKILDNPYEKQAWNYVISVKTNQPETYLLLLKSYKTWYEKYTMKM